MPIVFVHSVLGYGTVQLVRERLELALTLSRCWSVNQGGAWHFENLSFFVRECNFLWLLFFRSTSGNCSIMSEEAGAHIVTESGIGSHENPNSRCGLEEVKQWHDAMLGDHCGSLDRKTTAFTLGFLAGVQYQQQSNRCDTAAPLDELRQAQQTDVLFLDMDDTLYTNDWKVAQHITQNIRSYCTDVLGMPTDAAYSLYKKYGTTARGLFLSGIKFDMEDFKVKAHDITPVAHLIKPDPAMNAVLARAKIPMWIFTASTERHAHNCLGLLGIRHFFEDRIIACTELEMGFGSKYEEQIFNMARAAAGPTGMGRCYAPGFGKGGDGDLDPSRCYFADDSWTNIERAKKCGWHTCLIGHVTRDGRSAAGMPWADHIVHSVHELPKIWPHLFEPEAEEAPTGSKAAGGGK